MVGEWHVALQGLPETGKEWDIMVPARLLEDKALGSIDALENLTADVHWRLSLEHAGAIYRLHGQWQGSMMRQCSRCTERFEWHMCGETERDYQLGQRPVDDASESDYLLPPGDVFLPDVLREDIWLAWQADVVCSEACRGLCPQCGCNLNRQGCDCDRVDSGHPFAALAAWKPDA